MKRILLSSLLLGAAITMNAQADDNHSYGADDGRFKSLAEEVAKIEKHNDMFNVYFNYAASFRAEQDADKEWGTRFANKQLRLEIKGNITDHLYYRFRHRLNKANNAQSNDNFAKATDIMMVGYKFNDKWKVEAGKMCQIWGGFEFDENPMQIYQYSDMVDYMDNFMAGVTVSYKPIPTQEIAVEISDARNSSFADEYGESPVSVEKNSTTVRTLQKSKNALAYIVNWNGSFFNNRLLTRWSYGLQTEAKHKYGRMIVLGQQLNLPKVQWYFDYMGAFDGLDRLKLASEDAADYLKNVATHTGASNAYFSDVHYNSFITKLNWQFAPQWNVMVKGMYETADVKDNPQFSKYRKSYGYMGSVEYYPIKSQDFRIFLAYVGRKYDFSSASGLKDYNTNRFELGFMYRIKAF